MRALIFGLDTTLSGSASQIMSHERAVKTAFLAYAPEGTTADIVISSNSSVIDGQTDLFARIPRTSLLSYGPMVDLNGWLDAYPDRYDVMIFSYVTDRLWDSESERILRAHGIVPFSPMNNVASDGTANTDKFGNNIFYIGTGTTANTGQRGYRITGYTTASPSALTSYTTARAGAEYLKCKALGGTLEQVRKRFIQNFAGYPEKSVQNGFGSVPTAYADTTPDLLPPTTLWAFPSTIQEGQSVQLYFAPFYPQTQDGFRIYANDVQIFEGNGTSVNDAGWIGTADLRRATHAPTSNTTYRIVAYQGESESDSPAYVTQSVVVIPAVSPPPAPPPDPEPELPPVNPTPDIFITRTATALTATNDGGGQTTEWQYRTDISAPWSASVTTDTLSITPDPTATYQLRTRVTSGDITTEWAEAFSTGTQGASLPTIFL